MREIGSEFWDIPLRGTDNHIFPENTIWLQSGRAALDLIIQDIKYKKEVAVAAVPSYCCDSMVLPFLRNGLKVKFYPITLGPEGGLCADFSEIGDCDVLLDMDYFGYQKTRKKGLFSGICICDTTHSLFMNQHDTADYVFGSLRKWAGFWTGGYAWKNKGNIEIECIPEDDNAYIDLRQNAMHEKQIYMQGLSGEKRYLSIYAAAEAQLDEYGVFASHERDIFSARHLDVDFIKSRRRKNAYILLEQLSKWTIFSELEEQDCPLFVPLCIPHKQRTALRRYLIEKEIYCPIHWPISEHHRLCDDTKKLYDEELSIVCDQRYGPEDMERICKEILHFLGE